MARKYLWKNEFRYYTKPEYLSKGGKPHVAYITVKHNDKYKFNLITHSKTSFNSDTKELKKNPNRNKNGQKDKRPSRVSKPMWDKTKYFSKDKLLYWRFDKQDKAAIKKWNKKVNKKISPRDPSIGFRTRSPALADFKSSICNLT